MTHKIEVYNHENHSNNAQSFWVKVLYDSDGDDDKEVICDTKLTYSDKQVDDGKMEERFQNFAADRIDQYKADVDGSQYVGKELDVEP